jgi:hypothetical protein
VAGDPTKDIRTMERDVVFIMKNGVAYKNARSRPPST